MNTDITFTEIGFYVLCAPIFIIGGIVGIVIGCIHSKDPRKQYPTQLDRDYMELE
jgi:hypothetical protein